MPGSEETGEPSKVRSLRDALDQVRMETAQHSDVVVELREAERTRLTLLLDELASLAREIPPNDELFEFAITPGERPRLWIDMVAHVHMGPDKRTYRFVRDTRLGREVVGESNNISAIADKITDYVARRIVERQRALATGPIVYAASGAEESSAISEPTPAPTTLASSATMQKSKPPVQLQHRSRAGWFYFFVLGLTIAFVAFLVVREVRPDLLLLGM